MSTKILNRTLSWVTALALALAPLSTVPMSMAAPRAAKPTANKVILFASDGMRPDHMENYAVGGYMPTYKQLMDTGVKGDNGLVQAFPPNTGVGWYTLATGTWPGEHGSTNNTFFRTGESNFNNRTSFATTGILQADTIQEAAERAGKAIVSVEWVGSRNITPTLSGPVIDFRTFFSTRGVLAYPLNTTEQSGAATFGISYTVAAFTTTVGWTNVPASFSPAMQAQFLVRNTAFPASDNTDRFYDLYVYDSTSDSTTNYDRVAVVPSTANKDGNAAVADLAVGDWKDIKVTLTGARAGQTAGFYIKLITLANDLGAFKLYFTSIARANATYNGCTYAPGCSTALGFEETLNAIFPSSTAADFAPLEAGIIDEDTYVEQGLMWKDAHWAYLRYILSTGTVTTTTGITNGLGIQSDLLLLGTPVTDEFSHQFMGLVTLTDMDGNPNPYYDDVNGDGVKDNRITTREGYIRSAYEEADQTLGLGRALLGGNPTTFASSDHGFAPQWYAANARKILYDAMVTITSTAVSLQGSGANVTDNCRAASTDLTKACWAGGTMQIYINPAVVTSAAAIITVTNAITNAFAVLTDTLHPTATVVSAIYTKSQLRNVDGSDSLHPNRSGDVVVVLRPPYQWDAATAGQRLAFSQFFGQHGYMPNLVDIPHNVNMHGVFVAAGTGILSNTTVSGVRAIDVAPTIAFLMGIPGPQNARGQILYDIFQNSADWHEFTLLNLSDYHGQLTPLTENPDSLSATPSESIGGAAYLKPWFDVYENDAPGTVIRLAGGDSVGATPPISAFFADTPTVDIMNLMLLDFDGLGNHNFDRGESYLRSTLIPRAQFKYLSSNLAFPTLFMPIVARDAPLQSSEASLIRLSTAASLPGFGFGWEPSAVVTTTSGASLGLVGFSNDDLPLLTSPAGLGALKVLSSTQTVQAEVNKLRAQGVGAVVAFGHLGATAGTIASPTGPLIDLATAITGADAVIGDHSDFQALATLPNGVLVTENRSKGIRFTRVRLVVDTTSNAVIYKTADYHKPWDIGTTPDAAIQAQIDALNAQLAPLFSVIVGSSGVYIPRTDICGNTAGRTCESLVGNLTTDAMRQAYGVDFAITNSGGLRADLTCPTTDIGTDYCPAYTPPPYPISRGQVLGVLPFGNVVVTLQVNGAELKTMLENGVSFMPSANGRFPQVSGLCVTYNISGTVGNRVVGAVRQAADGACTSAAVDLTSASTYSITENDFMANGGDGYPNYYSRSTTQNIMDQVLADYITALGTVTPTVQSRINCEANGVHNGGACPVGAP